MKSIKIYNPGRTFNNRVSIRPPQAAPGCPRLPQTAPTSTREIYKMNESLRKPLKIFTNLLKFIKINTNQCKSIKNNANSLKSMKILIAPSVGSRYGCPRLPQAAPDRADLHPRNLYKWLKACENLWKYIQICENPASSLEPASLEA